MFLAAVAAMSAALACGAAETDKAILPGWGKYFWNQKSMWYIHPPAFDFTNVTGAVRYRYRVIDDAHRLFEFTSPKPTESLEQVWTNLPPKGMVTVICHGVDAKGADCALAGKLRTFSKNAPFDPAKAPGAAEGHLGLEGMRERAKRLGASVEITTEKLWTVVSVIK